jgi:hypothetical protein
MKKDGQARGYKRKSSIPSPVKWGSRVKLLLIHNPSILELIAVQPSLSEL